VCYFFKNICRVRQILLQRLERLTFFFLPSIARGDTPGPENPGTAKTEESKTTRKTIRDLYRNIYIYKNKHVYCIDRVKGNLSASDCT